MIRAAVLGCAAAAAILGACGRAPVRPPEPRAPAAADSTGADSLARRIARMASPELPPVPRAEGPLALQVTYPAAGSVLDVGDSTFLFGTAGNGSARVTLNGAPVAVWPNGAWLAWVAVPRDSVVRFDIAARTATDSARIVHEVRRWPRYRPPDGAAVWIDSTSLAPVGLLWVSRGEFVTLRASAAPGTALALRLPGGSAIPLVPDSRFEEVPEAVRAFDRDSANLRAVVRTDRYVGVVRGRPLGPNPGAALPAAAPPAPVATTTTAPMPAPVPDSLWPVLEAVRGTDTARVRWPLQMALLDTLPLVVELNDDPAGLGVGDSVTVGRAVAGGTYRWFFPLGTRAAAVGRLNDELRIRLAPAVEAWVPAADARLFPAGTPAPRATVGSLTLTALEDRVRVRIPLSLRIPFEVTESERSLALDLYGAGGDVNWIRYPTADPLVERVQWSQDAGDVVRLTFDLADPVWGYRTRWERGDLVLEIRRPPRIDPDDPLRRIRIVVDAGHPPGGASGPTGLRESEANLAVALQLRSLLADAGAEVIMTRTADVAVDLGYRPRFADSAGADLLVSIHNNALPDGINPFINNGTSVFYNHPRSIPLARAIQAALVRRLGLRDLGVGRGDLALVRPTWMPAVLTEGLFVIVPDQEAALRAPEGQRRYALGVYDGIRQFLAERGW